MPLSRVNGAALGVLRAPGLYVVEGGGARRTIAVNVGDPQVSNLSADDARAARARQAWCRRGASDATLVVYSAVVAFVLALLRMVDVAAADHGMTWHDLRRLRRALAAARAAARVAGPRAARTNFNPRQRLAAGGAAIAAARALALRAGPAGHLDGIVAAVRRLRRRRLAQRLEPRNRERGAARSTSSTRQLRPAHSRIVAFGTTALPLDEHRRRCAGWRRSIRDAASRAALDRSGTDLEAALDGRAGELAPGHVPRIVLFSDGRRPLGTPAPRSHPAGVGAHPGLRRAARRAVARRHLDRRDRCCRPHRWRRGRSPRRSASAASATAIAAVELRSTGSRRWRGRRPGRQGHDTRVAVDVGRRRAGRARPPGGR